MAVERKILEPARDIAVCAEADVVVVGGGPAGVAAAVAAARNGARTVLVERYGHLGGMATGGLVTLYLHMSDGGSEQQIAGICQETVDRLDALGGARYPKKEELGSADPAVLRHWQRFYGAVLEGRLRLSVAVDPELLKCVFNDMVVEAGIKLLLHSWGARAIADGGTVHGVVFESKSGRQAVLGQVTIDATGDGDLFPSAEADFDANVDSELRSSQLALVFRVEKVDFERFCRFREEESQQYNEALRDLRTLVGFQIRPWVSSREDVVWFNNWIPGLSALNVEDLTAVELRVRGIMLEAHKFLKARIPGFQSSRLLDTASQIGTRGSRRLAGEYAVTGQDIRRGTTYHDTIAVFPKVNRSLPTEQPHVQIPYRALVPRAVDGLLAAGRNFSSDALANNTFNLIPHCVALGEAAGTAAALAVKQQVQPRNVDVTALQDRLIAQGVPLPGVVLAPAS